MPLSLQVPAHRLPDPIILPPDKDRCCSDPMLPHTLARNFPCSMCEETPALCHPPLKLNAASSVWSGPTDAPRQNSRVHPVQDDGLKQQTHWIHTGHVEPMEQITTTNQNLVAWPRDIHVHTCGRQNELRPKLVDELITATQTQHFNERRNLCHTPRFGSTAPVSSTMTSSENGYTLSLTTKGALIILSRWRSISAGLMEFPS